MGGYKRGREQTINAKCEESRGASTLVETHTHRERERERERGRDSLGAKDKDIILTGGIACSSSSSAT